jgi:RNA recognition motif-containing protein
MVLDEKQLNLSQVKFSYKFSRQPGGVMNIYVGNLSAEVSEEDLRQAFEAFGDITSVNIIKDKFSGKSRGFGFVEMPSNEEAQSAIEGLNGTDLKGQALNVSEARPRSETRSGRRDYGDRRDRRGNRGGYGGSKGGYPGGKGKYSGGRGGRGGNR